MVHECVSSGRYRRLAAAIVATALSAMFGASGSLARASAAALPPGCSQSGQIVSCSVTFTLGSNPFAVPAGVTSIHVVAVGGMGGSAALPFGPAGTGGNGAVVSGDLAVTGRSALYAVVGANANGPTPGGPDGGAPGTTVSPLVLGGGGGGSSDVRTSQNDLSSRLLVAGGGGGAGLGGGLAPGSGVTGGAGGGHSGDATGSAADGGGGGSSGSAGGSGGTGGSCASFTVECSAGGAGSSGASGGGGAGGSGSFDGITGAAECVPPAFRLAAGRECVAVGSPGGGGGGGLFGGGGGGGGAASALAPYAGAGAGGGGGSNLVPPGGSQSVDTTGVPQIEISYKLVPTTIGQCLHGGWQNYPQFKNVGDCVSFVETGK